MDESTSGFARAPEAPRTAQRSSRTLVGRVLDLFSSVPLGIAILTVLFLYSTVGSAGIIYPVSARVLDAESWRHEIVRQWPVFEMTEFEWFHTPFFLVVCGLLGANIAITTIRRIPFRVVNLGVWMIHTGIITLLIGSVIYFGTKVEGDTPVVRREIVARIGDTEVRVPALDGAERIVRSDDGVRTVRVVRVDPEWPLLSGDDAGKKVFSVSVLVEREGESGSKAPARFVRQLLDGFPQFTEDVIPGRGRAVKLEEFGERVVDPEIEMTLEPSAQAWYWIRDSVAIGVREHDHSSAPSPWSQRIVKGLPRYNDLIGSPDDVWPSGDRGFGSSIRPVSIEVPAGAEPDGLGGVSARITGFLRYAAMEDRREPVAPGHGGDPIPIVDLVATNPAGNDVMERIALSGPNTMVPAFGGVVEVCTELEAPDAFLDIQSLTSSLAVAVGDQRVTLDPEALAPGTGASAIGETGWSVRVVEVLRRIDVGQREPISLAVLELTSPEGQTFTRWAFPDPAMTRDLDSGDSRDPHGGELQDREVDERITTTFHPGTSAVVVLAIRPGGSVGVYQRGPTGEFESRSIDVGGSVAFGGGASIRVAAAGMTSRAVSKPVIIPRASRDRDSDAERVFALAQLELASGSWTKRVWLPFNKYSFDDPAMDAAGLSRVEPVVVRLPDGRDVELIFTRERRPLPAPVMLDNFVVTSTIGGFTGDMSSIRDWTSLIRFDDGQEWGPQLKVETNEPAEQHGLRFFQAYWDAPREGSAGMSFTGLGVGNRRGVGTQLAGCIIAVTGMVYAFYVKPIIKRRRRERIEAELVAQGIEPKGRRAMELRVSELEASGAR